MGFREVWGFEPVQNLMSHEKSGPNSQILGIAMDDHYGFMTFMISMCLYMLFCYV